MTYYQTQTLNVKNLFLNHEAVYQRLARAKEYIDEYYPRNIGLHEMKEEAAYSKFHFLRMFKLTYGITPHQYLTEVRIDRAKKLLLQDVHIKQVCFSIGFYSIASFTGIFKRWTGRTPSSYQKNKQRKSSAPAELLYSKIYSLKNSNF